MWSILSLAHQKTPEAERLLISHMIVFLSFVQDYLRPQRGKTYKSLFK